MTVAVAIQCEDGIVLAADSLATFSRGAPVTRKKNKLHIIRDDKLRHPIALAGAGASAFLDKFIDRARREYITHVFAQLNRQLDIVDFVEKVGESICADLFKEYMIDRTKFFEDRYVDYDLALIVAGATRDGEMKCYHIHTPGLAESIEAYGTVGSGAAYAELFLHGILSEPDEVRVDEAVKLACYAVKGVEIMDHNVGGEVKVCKLVMSGDQLVAEYVHQRSIPQSLKEKMEQVLRSMGENIREIVAKENREASSAGDQKE